MRPTMLRRGDQVSVRTLGGLERIAFFVRRERAEKGRPAKNFLRFPDFAGINGPDDDGTCEMSDYDVSRKVFRFAETSA